MDVDNFNIMKIIVCWKIIRVYPNPVNHSANDEVSGANKNFRLYNPIGELVLSGVLNSQISTIDLSSLAPNVYILNIENQSIRLIKTK